MGQAYPFSRNARNVYTWTDGLSTKRGKHTLRMTGQYTRQQVNSFWPQYPAGLLSFNEGLTSLPGIVDTGDALATFSAGHAVFRTRKPSTRSLPISAARRVRWPSATATKP